MKTILATMILVLGAQAQAAVIADAVYTTIKCERSKPVPDLGLSVEVQQGGFAGLTDIVVSEFFMGHVNTVKTYVKAMPTPTRRLGAPMVLEGQDIRLSINFTTAPIGQDGHIGYLERNIDGQTQTDELTCQSVVHPM